MKNFFLGLIFISLFTQTNAQTVTQAGNYSLQEAINYATANNNYVKNVIIDQKITEAQRKDLLSRALPQINANVDFNHYIDVQKNILENNPGSSFYNPNNPIGSPIPLQLGLPNQFLPSVTASQVVFDQSFFSSIGASKVSRQIAEQNIKKIKIDVAYNVVRSYYSVLVNEKQLSFIDNNLLRIDSTYKETRARYRAGLARKLEVDQIEVSFNNLKEQRTQVLNTIQLSIAALKYQMHVPGEIVLTDSLSESLLNIPADNNENFFNQRVEYSIIQNQQLYNEYDIKSTRGAYFPKLTAVAAYGYNPAATKLSDIGQSGRWLNYDYVGFRFQMPLFNGFAMRYKVQQKKLLLEETVNSKDQLERSIELEADQAKINLTNSLQSIKIQKRNVDLAQENLRVLKREYELGIAINLQVTTAEASLKEAQTNYYNALYNALLYKTDYDRATGNLIK